MAVAMKWPRHRTPKIDGEGEMIMKKALPTWRVALRAPNLHH